MTSIQSFKDTLSEAKSPERLPPPLLALWYAAKDNWDRAHEIVQEETDADSAWVHAYLHRVEGDLPNARYWYNQAGQKRHTGALNTEWEEITTELLGKLRA